MSFHRWKRARERYPFWTQRHRPAEGRCVGLHVPGSRGNGKGNHLKGWWVGTGKVSFILFSFFLSDFYQNTEIQHTHKPAQKRSALFTAIAGACPPGQPPAGWGGRGGQPQQEEEPRQEKTEGKKWGGGGQRNQEEESEAPRGESSGMGREKTGRLLSF